MNKKVVVCLSGGADSATVLYLARHECNVVHALSVDYGQRHKKELECARELTRILNVPHKIVNFDLTTFGGSPLTDNNIDVPEQADNLQATTVVPYRNTILATLAAAYARVNGLNTIYMGPTYEDLAQYPDCRPVFYEALEHLLRLGDNVHDLTIVTPFIRMIKRQIVQVGLQLGVDYSKTWTCYKGLDYPCLKCDSCRERMISFRLNNMKDPLVSDADWAEYLKERL